MEEKKVNTEASRIHTFKVIQLGKYYSIARNYLIFIIVILDGFDI
jgi:hypothetical protein